MSGGADPFPDASAFGSTKREILLILKRDGESDLQRLAERLSLSKMAIHRHVTNLEARGLVERFPLRHGPGRPRLALRLAPKASDLFPKSYAGVTCSALAFIEEKLGRSAVEEALRRRQKDTAAAYRPRVGGDTLEERVEALTAIRDEEGYMAEARSVGKGAFEILEHNCPIIAIAEQYGEACGVEREMFRNLLKADVETTHRVVAGAHVCRFLVQPRRSRGG